MTALTEEATQFDAFGAPLVLDVPGTGREYDRDTALYYYRARYYDPEVGRFISEDPLGFDAGDTNFYAYVVNNPINFNDPSGNVNVPFGDSDGNGNFPGSVPTADFPQPLSADGPIGCIECANFVQGVISLPNGVGNAIDFGTQISGLRGAELQARAQLNLAIFGQLFDQALANPDQTFALAADFAAENPALVSGRFLTGSAISAFLTSRVGPAGTFAGLGLAGTAAFGDAINAIENGIGTLENVVPAAVGGELGANIPTAPGASGGFVLYPNKPNTNTLRAVYSK